MKRQRTKQSVTSSPARDVDTRARVLLVDDHPMVRERLGELINQQADLVTCGEAENPHHALELAASTNPHVVIVDLSLKDAHGIELLKDLKLQFPKVLTLVVSMHDESLYAERAIRAGARGYITKQEATKKVIDGIRRVLKGEIVVSEKMASVILHRLAGARATGENAPLSKLTDREMEVFQLLGEGLPAREIARTLHVSVKTIEAHREHIKAKLNFKTSGELLRYAIQSGSA